MKNKKRNGIESLILKANGLIKQDEEGYYYIPICNFPSHIGVIKNERTCLNRVCNEYSRYYLIHQHEPYKIYPEKFPEESDLSSEEVDSKKIKCPLEDLK